MSGTAGGDPRALRRQLRAYIARARENERKLNRLQDFELKLVSSAGLDRLLELILAVYPRNTGLDQAALVLFDPDDEWRHYLAESGRPVPAGLHLRRGEPASLPREPWLGTCGNGAPLLVREALAGPCASAALLPLRREDRTLGALVLASRDPARYPAGSGSAFLERLAAFVAVSLENALNHERVKRLGLLDPLTGAYNRRYFEQRLAEECRRSARTGQPLSCLFLDLDHFKRINDTRGHAAGDAVLRAAAATIRGQLRDSDVLARYGGEEFVVLLVDTGTALAGEIAERIRRAVAASPVSLDRDPPVAVTLSAGVATAAGDAARDAEGLLRRADAALYRAKAAGRDRVAVAGAP